LKNVERLIWIIEKSATIQKAIFKPGAIPMIKLGSLDPLTEINHRIRELCTSRPVVM
jgi:hypothetical protein